MPPVNQGSRAALVTWTVVTSFLFVTATIFGIYFYVEASRVTTENRDLKEKYKSVVTEAALSGSDVTTLTSVRGNSTPPYDAGASLLNISVQRSERLAKTLSGSTNPETAMTNAKNAIASAGKKVAAAGLKLQSDNVVNAMNLLADAVVQRNTEATNARKEAEAATASLQQAQKDQAAQIAKLTDALASVRADQAKAAADYQTLAAQKDTNVNDIQAGADSKLKEAQDALNKANVQVAELTRTIETDKKQFDAVQEKLRGTRPDVNKPVLSQADGHIIRLPGAGVCFIDLGQGDQLIAGMTFEVYDRNEGIPPIGDPNTDVALPKGKASIEVTRVGATSSECRVVNSTPGQAITEGDIIANLVYDKNTKNKFLVYGAFDLDRDGKATAQDSEVVKRLITQWGGDVVPDINVDTDFVVLGVEPVIPSLTKEERDDPIQKAIYDKAVADSEAYQNISNKARDYRIPILNQNRFLYLIGYYELSKR